MASNEVQAEGEALTYVFDPNVDFKKFESLETSELSPEISYLIDLSKTPNKSKTKYLLINTSHSKTNYYTFDEEEHYKQLVSYVVHPYPEVTNSSLAEVHRLKLPPHCLSRTLPCQINSLTATHLLRDISFQNLILDKEENSELLENLLNFKSFGNYGDMEKFDFDNNESQPSIHSFLRQHTNDTETKHFDSNDSTCQTSSMNASKSQLILVPHEDRSGHQHEVIQEVFRYPPESIETIVERNKSSSVSSAAGRSRKLKKNANKKKFHASQSSLCSTNSALSCQSASSLASQTDSVISRGSSNKSFGANDSENIRSSNHFGNGKVASHNDHEKCGSDAMSDSSSNLSTMSDLSGYEDEYVMIKRLVSDHPNKVYGKRVVSESLRKKTYLETRLKEQEGTIKSLNSLKEDLEIQVHRLSVQLQNSVREKEVCQEQLEVVQTKLTEKKQQEYFELMKDKLSVEGQNETLKQELHHYSTTNADLDAKLIQTKNNVEILEKNRLKLCNKESELKNALADSERQCLKLKNELTSLNETYILEHNLNHGLQSELNEKELMIKELEVKIETSHQECDSYQETICSLKKWNMEYSEREEQHRIVKKRMDNLISESADKSNSLKESCDWYQVQLTKAQEQLSELQNELTETKSSSSVVFGDRDRLKREVERLNVEIEDNRVKAMRDKSLLLVQLEELEADMKERELAIRRLEEGDKVSQVKISEERFKRLEEDHKRLHEMKIEMRDVLRHNDSLKEDLKRKSFVAKKNEDSIRDLRKDFAVTQEKMSSKDIRIDVLEKKLHETKLKLEKSYDKIKENDVALARLKEQKLQLEASSLTAEQDKKQVDETIAKLKEDMSKLSSNFFRMKHDLSAKDKQIETLLAQNTKVILAEKEKSSEVEKLEAQLKNDEKEKLLVNEINTLKELLSKSAEENSCIKTEYAQAKKCLDSAELEKNSVLNALKLRDEQIENMQGVIDTYKEKILQKDEEIFTRKEHGSKLERNFDDFQKKFNRLNNEYQLQLQEKEEIRQLEANYRHTVSELKDSIKLEKRAKDSWDKKYKEKLQELTNVKEELEDKNRINVNLSEVIKRLKAEAEKIKMEEGVINALNEELTLRYEILTKQESDIQCLTSQLEESKKSLKCKQAQFDEAIGIKNNEIVNLRDSLNTKNSEMKNLESIITETKQKRENAEINSRLHSSRIERNSIRQNFKKGKNLKHVRDEKMEIETLKQKLKETAHMVTKRDEENSELKAVLSNFETQKELLNKFQLDLEDSVKQRILLKGENESLTNHYTSLQNDLRIMNENYITKGEECNKWRVKFENLNDTIPQRDTNPFHKMDGDQLTSQRSYHECISPIHSHERAQVTHEEEGALQEERIKFSQTMVYLQRQISLMAEALKNKDRQIIELNKQLNTLSLNPNADKNGLSSQDRSTMTDTPTTTENDVTKELSKELASLQEVLTNKESDFKEKKRRYESNLRLLTRKLKEHMKGRRTAEKELEVVTQEQKTSRDEDEKRYNVLKNRYIDLEKKCQNLESDLTARDTTNKEKDSAIFSLEKEIEKERNMTLQMQKEIGQQEQLKLCMENLRREMNELSFDLVNKNKKMQELEESLRSSLMERESLEAKIHSLSLQVSEMRETLEEEIHKVAERDELVISKEDKLTKCEEDTNSLKVTLSDVQLKCSRLEESLERVQTEDGNNTKKISLLNEEIEELKGSIDIKNALIKDITVKKAILEKELEIKQGVIESAKLECAEIKKQWSENEEKNQSSISLLNKRISEANEMESSLNGRLSAIHKEKLALQAHCTQLKMALNSALEKLKGSSASLLPSPSPLNTEALTKLMELGSKPAQTSKFMKSLSERLHSLRKEVSVLQTEIKSRDQVQ